MEECLMDRDDLSGNIWPFTANLKNQAIEPWG